MFLKLFYALIFTFFLKKMKLNKIRKTAHHVQKEFTQKTNIVARCFEKQQNATKENEKKTYILALYLMVLSSFS